MGVVITPDSEYAKELAKWNAPKRLGGYNANGFEPFPQMVYRATKLPSGKVVCMDVDPLTGEPYQGCYRTVGNAEELARAEREGWCTTPKAAKEAFEREEQALGNAAAEALAAAKSDLAKRELDEMNALTMAHVPDVTPATKKQLKQKAAEGLT